MNGPDLLDLSAVSPGVATLATALSVAVRIEPELIRAVRVEILPTLDVGDEADLWFSDLVGVREPASITLDSAIRHDLHTQLARLLTESSAAHPIRGLWTVISRVHEGTSPALLLEERVTWLAISEGAGATASINSELQRAVDALVVEGRRGISDWFAGAWGRLPPAARATTAAWKLRTATQFLRGITLQPADETGTAPELTDLADVVGLVPDAEVYVRRDADEIVIGAQQPRDGTVAVLVPDTQPRIVEIEEGRPAGSSRTSLAIPHGESARLSVGSGSIRLRTARGHVYQIPRVGIDRRWRYFISYAASNVREARAIKQWLAQQDSSLADDIFLDADVLQPGVSWSEALVASAGHCEAIIYLVSNEWQASDECRKEYIAAEWVGKAVIGARLDASAQGISKRWPMVDLYPDVSETEKIIIDDTWLELSRDGLQQLHIELRRTAVGAQSFVWPPSAEPDRSPYRGWEAFGQADAGVFFGRDEDVVDCLDQLRRIRSDRTANILVIAGAARSGKSSLLRAGVLPNLLKTSSQFVVLDTVAPETALNGPDGLAEAIFIERSRLGLSRPNLADIRRMCSNDINRVRDLLHECQRAVAPHLVRRGKPDDDGPNLEDPTVVLPVDDGDDLFSPHTDQARAFQLTVHDLTASLGDGLRLIVVATVRTATLESVADKPPFTNTSTFELRPSLSARSWSDAIFEPASRSTQADRRLELDSELEHQLIGALTGSHEGLALISITMSRLFDLHGRRGRISIDDYYKLGEVNGAVQHLIDTTVATRDLEAQLSTRGIYPLLREAFIPWLVTVRTDNTEVLARSARLDDLPTATQPLVERFIARRLLQTYRREGETFVQIAFQSLFTYWNDLAAWIVEDVDRLRLADDLDRRAADWQRHPRSHRLLAGTALANAEALIDDPRYAGRLSGTRDFLAASQEYVEGAESTSQAESWVGHARELRDRSLDLTRDGQPQDGLSVAQEAVQIYRQLVDREPARYAGDLATALSAQATAQLALDRREDALAAIAEASAITRLAPVGFRRELADLQAQAGDIHGALAVLQEAIDDATAKGVDESDTLTARATLALWRARSGDLGGAVNEFGALLTDQQRTLGPNDPDTLHTRGELAYWRGRDGDAAVAVAAFEALVPDQIEHLGNDHRDTLASRGSLAYFRGHSGDIGGAIAGYSDLLADYQRLFGVHDINALKTRANLAYWYGRAGETARAIAEYEALLTVQTDVLGPTHADTRGTQNQLIGLRGEADPSGAVEALESLLADQLRDLGAEHPGTFTTRANLGNWRGRSGDAAGAIRDLEALLADQTRVLGGKHPDTRATRSSLRRWQRGANQR